MPEDYIEKRSVEIDDRHAFDVLAVMQAEGHCVVQARDLSGRAVGPKIEITATDLSGSKPARISPKVLEGAVDDVVEQVLADSDRILNG